MMMKKIGELISSFLDGEMMGEQKKQWKFEETKNDPFQVSF